MGWTSPPIEIKGRLTIEALPKGPEFFVLYQNLSMQATNPRNGTVVKLDSVPFASSGVILVGAEQCRLSDVADPELIKRYPGLKAWRLPSGGLCFAEGGSKTVAVPEDRRRWNPKELFKGLTMGPPLFSDSSVKAKYFAVFGAYARTQAAEECATLLRVEVPNCELKGLHFPKEARSLVFEEVLTAVARTPGGVLLDLCSPLSRIDGVLHIGAERCTPRQFAARYGQEALAQVWTKLSNADADVALWPYDVCIEYRQGDRIIPFQR